MIPDPMNQVSMFSSSSFSVAHIKWKYFFATTILKLYSNQSKLSKLSTFVYYINIFFYLLPAVYYVSSYIGENTLSKNPEFEVFPSSLLFSIITPGLFPTTFYLFIVLIFILASSFTYLKLLKYPELIRQFYWIVNPDLHSFLLPLLMGTFSYCAYTLFALETQIFAFQFLCGLIFFIFLVYFTIQCFVIISLQVSMFKPNIQ